MLSRRLFLKTSLAGLGVGAGFATNLASFNAYAANYDDYRALVCIFLYGGLDSHDTVIPYDLPSFSNYELIREPLLAQYDRVRPRRRDHLLELQGGLGGRTFAFPPEMENLHNLYQSGSAALIGNVGPLIEPLNKNRFENGSGVRPPKLFSHNDQQSVWMASRPEGAVTGWGGRFADSMQAAGANSEAAFTTVSTSGTSIFLTGNSVKPYVTSRFGPSNVRDLGRDSVFSRMYEEAIRDTSVERTNLFERDLISIANSSIDNNELLAEQLALGGDPMMNLGPSKLSEQLALVARMIERRSSLGLKRQIFFVSANGYDTHSMQAAKLPELQADLDQSIGAFYGRLSEMGVQNSVTTFTASDFGRTLGVNGDGTDHGWGAHHIVVGGAVNGGKIHGSIPTPELGHDQDAGRGRLIPQISVHEYAAALGGWFGLTSSELDDALPGLRNFDHSNLRELFN